MFVSSSGNKLKTAIKPKVKTLQLTTAQTLKTMKKLVILFAVIGLALNVAVAENVKPAAKAKVTVEHNGYNFVDVTVKKETEGTVLVKIYDNDFALIHTENWKNANAKRFDISKLTAGHYILKVVADGETVYSEAIEKVK